MADISMCDFDKCPLSSTCYRYLAKADKYQAYFILSKEQKDNVVATNKCSEYWKCDTAELLEKYDKYWSDII